MAKQIGFFYWVTAKKNGEVLELSFSDNADDLFDVVKDMRHKFRKDDAVRVRTRVTELKDRPKRNAILKGQRGKK